MYIIIIFFLVFVILINNKEHFEYEKFLKMNKLSTNNITIKDTLTLNTLLKTNKFCIDEYCIEEKNLDFMDDMPRYNKEKLWFEDSNFYNKDYFNLKNYWFEDMVILYYGNIKLIPTGWLLCDGKNGTPDLRNKFVIGAGRDYKLGDTGGEENVTLKEQHLPKHRHSFNPRKLGGPENNKYNGEQSLKSVTNGKFIQSNAYIPITDINKYMGTSTFDFTSVGKSKKHNNMPPYYGLYYIIKIRE
tara:strand:+ start:1863 stop:2594 length:732 start_codon:yes stop_codon:yes gene_type:complete